MNERYASYVRSKFLLAVFVILVKFLSRYPLQDDTPSSEVVYLFMVPAESCVAK